MTRTPRRLRHIYDGDFGVRSGVYAALSPLVSMQMDEYGEYQYVFTGSESDETLDALLRVDLMSDESVSEDVLAEECFGSVKGIKYDEIIGYHTDLYAGYVAEGDYREKGSSGGFTSWILDRLIQSGKVDAVIHAAAVNPEVSGNVLFRYVISRNSEEVRGNAKSRYYPLELSGVLQEVLKTPGRYAVVGIPEFISELRLLARENEIIKERLVYTVGLVCGHQKTAKYAEALAWQGGIGPGNLKSVDFRIKQPNRVAYEYLQQFEGTVNGVTRVDIKSHDQLLADHWPLGFFKSKFSDFTDNAFNEMADVVLGDAWLDEYNADGMGNNIVIVRNPEIAKIIKDGIKHGSLHVDTVNPETIKRSQSGLIHHIRDELPYRLIREKQRRPWVPTKRVEPSAAQISKFKKRVQDVRRRATIASRRYYLEAVRRNDWSVFHDPMTKIKNQYERLYNLSEEDRNDTRVQSVRKKLAVRSRLKRGARYLKHKTRVRTRVRGLIDTLHYKKEWRQLAAIDGALITLPGYYNYGNMVQRFALQHFLKKNGLNFISYAKDIPIEDKDQEKLRYTSDFVERNIWRKQFDSRDRFKAYIVGSDQVWRKWGYDDIFDELGYYFLDFTKDFETNRIAYAASIGQDSLKDADYTEEYIPYAGELARKFSHVSMRELSGVDIVKKEWEVTATHVLDPTMLLEAEDYEKLIEAAPYDLNKPGELFTYCILTNEEKKAMIASISKDVGIKDNGIYLEKSDILRPVEEWLQNIRDAKLVVTDSFHGMVFCILFNTPFIVLESGTGGSARITTLLGKLGLEERYIVSDKVKNFKISDVEEIDWPKVNAKLERLRAESAEWLLKAIASK